MFYNPREDRIELSVRELCAQAFKGGHLDSRVPPHFLYQRSREGQKVHAAICELRKKGEGVMASAPSASRPRGSEAARYAVPELPTAAYHAEVPLKHLCRLEGITFSVSGRADGVWYDPAGGCMVEEVKSIRGATDAYLRSPREADLAQLVCYGYFLCATKGLSSVTLRLTYAGLGKESEAVCVDRIMTEEALKAAYISILSAILPRAKDCVDRETTLRSIAAKAVFPYGKMRAAQKDMILECWRDMRMRKTLFAEAPTGIGKTIATLYPAVRCYGERKFDKIFYLTAKNATRREAFSAARKLNLAGTPVRACVITARESVCLCEAARADGERLSSHCHPDACPYAKGYYDRIESVLWDILSDGKTLFSDRDIRAAAEKWQVCPYELALDLSELCEIVICDYNYVFSPNVYLRRYFADGIPGTEGHRYAFLVDEAHNLPDRARDMYSASLSLSEVCDAQEAMHAAEASPEPWIFPDEDQPHRNELTAAHLDDLVGTVFRMRERCAETMIVDEEGIQRGVSLSRIEPVHLCEEAQRLSALCDRWLRRNHAHPLYPVVDRLASALSRFSMVGAYFDQRFATFVEVEGDDVTVRIICLDPAGVLRPILNKAETGVLFSATLTPSEYFADILGGGRDSLLVHFSSPFPTDHLCVAVCDEVSTRYDDREQSLRRIMGYIAATVTVKRGHYMVYFPSYDYMEQVHALFEKKYPKVKTVKQKQGMTYAEREAFIAAFTPEGDDWLVGFCVLGGSFSEGVDLPGRSLIGAVIVGVGLPGLSNERNIMREYYDATRGDADSENAAGGEGYAYAYTYPGMNRVLQAAGRVIRRAEDYGVVVLIDDRYTARPYLDLYPAHWEQLSSCEDMLSLRDYLEDFWSRVEEGKTPDQTGKE